MTFHISSFSVVKWAMCVTCC